GAEWLVKPVLTGFDSFYYHPDQKRLITFVKNGKKGVVNLEGKVIVPPIYVNLMPNAEEDFISCTKGSGKPEDYNDRGQLICEGYEDCSFINSHLFKIKQNDKWGITDHYRNLLVPTEYDAIDRQGAELKFVLKKAGEATFWTAPAHLAEKKREAPGGQKKETETMPGRILVRDKAKTNSKYGFTDLAGDTVVPAIYHFAHHYKEAGLSYASLDGKSWGVIDKSNKKILDFAYGKPRWFPPDMRLPVRKGDKGGVIQLPEAKIIVPFEYEDLVPIRDNPNAFLVMKEKKWGIVDAAGKIILPLDYEYIGENNHRTLAMKKDGLVGTWSPISGKVVSPVYKKVADRQSMICTVMRDSLWALYNSVEGKELTPFQYTNISASGKYYLGELSRDGKKLLSLLDKNGREVVPPENAKMQGLHNGSYWVERAENSEQRDSLGNLLQQFPKGKAYLVYNAWIQVKSESGARYFHAYNQPGQEVWLENLGELKEEVRAVKHNGKFGYMDNQGNWVVQPVFDAAHESGNGCLKVKYQGKWGVLKNPVPPKG
ncbi:MAG: WG repeat-containing protein, partial [Bacteroidota bacterium]